MLPSCANFLESAQCQSDVVLVAVVLCSLLASLGEITNGTPGILQRNNQ